MSAHPAVPVVVLTAAVLHAAWNALAHRLDDKLAGFAVIALVQAACAGLLACLVPLPAPAAWPFVAAATALQVAYALLLVRAYRLGDFGQMYPIARGTSPLLVAVASVALLHQPLSRPDLLGVAVICGGLAGLALADGLPTRRQLPALAAAFATGLVIASYTLVDGVGVRRSGTVPGYVAWIFLCQGVCVFLTVAVLRGPVLLRQVRATDWRGPVGGVLSLLAYGLVLWAQAHGSLATVAALRETSIVFAALLGTVLFRERLGGRRITAAAAVLLGIGLLELAHG